MYVCYRGTKLELTKSICRRIVETVGGNGIPPSGGFQFFSAGLDQYLSVFTREYLDTYIKEGNSSFKMVVGAYGGGKTHFLYSIRDLAWKRGYLVSYVPLSASDTPFSKLELVYSSIIRNITTPQKGDAFTQTEKGIREILNDFIKKSSVSNEKELDSALSDFLPSIDNTNFQRALKNGIKAALDKNENELLDITQWFNCDGYDRTIHGNYKIFNPITRGNAFSMIRSISQMATGMKYSGLVILFDEGETIPSMSTREKDIMLSNLREIVDSCVEGSLRNVLILYAVPDENFLEGKTHVYEALKQRTQTIFNFFNPSGVKINLEELSSDPINLLVEIGTKLLPIFNKAYEITLPQSEMEKLIKKMAETSYSQRFGDIGYKRLFVQGIIRGFQYFKSGKESDIDRELAEQLLINRET